MGVGVCICNGLTCVLGAYYRVDREIIGNTHSHPSLYFVVILHFKNRSCG